MFAVIFIPDFSLQAVLRHEPDLISRPAALMDPELTKLGIIQLTSSARSAGVCEGMTASQAMGRCAELVIKSRAPSQEQSATEVLMETAYAFSPFIESTGPGICTIELRGLRAQENETSAREWVEEIRKVLGRFYLDGRIGFAVTPELALLAARMADIEKLQAPNSKLQRNSKSQAPNNLITNSGILGSVVIVSDIAEFASGLPIQMLGLTEEMLEILNRWGITTVGALLALGKDQIVARLGPGAIELFERFSPNSIRPLKLASLPETFAEQIEFENPIETLETLLFVLRRFTEQLSRRIELLYLVVAELHLKLGLASGAAYESVFKVPSPTGNAEILFRMLHTHLENVRTDAPISLLWLAAKPGRPEAHQFGLFETTLRNPNQFAETLARLEALCGPNRVGTPCLEPTLRPDSFRMKPAKFCESGEKKKTSGASRAKNVRARRLQPQAGPRAVLGSQRPQSEKDIHMCTERPEHLNTLRARNGSRSVHRRGLQLRRFRPALPARVEFREQAPALIRSAVCNGAIVDRRGPFLSSGNWWDATRWWRQEWDVQMVDGRMYRIFRTTETLDRRFALTPSLSPKERENHRSTRLEESASFVEECLVEGVYD